MSARASTKIIAKRYALDGDDTASLRADAEAL